MIYLIEGNPIFLITVGLALEDCNSGHIIWITAYVVTTEVDFFPFSHYTAAIYDWRIIHSKWNRCAKVHIRL